MGTITIRKGKDSKGKSFKKYQAEVRINSQYFSKRFDTRTSAKIYIAEQEALINKGFDTTIGRKLTMEEAIDKYVSEITVQKKTWKKEKSAWKLLKKNNKRFTELKINQVMPQHILDLKNHTAKRGKVASNLELKLLSHLFTTAIKVWRYVELNPVTPIDLFSTPKGRYAPIYFSEYRKILNLIKTDLVLYLFVLILRNGGFRPIEVYALTHNDIDLVKNVIVVRQQKKNNHYRIVPIKPYLMKLITKSKIILGSHLIIPTNRNTLESRWMKIKHRNSIVDRQFYDFRRSFAHNFLDYKKGDLIEMCKIGGWSDWEMAHRYYGKDSVRMGA